MGDLGCMSCVQAISVVLGSGGWPADDTRVARVARMANASVDVLELERAEALWAVARRAHAGNWNYGRSREDLVARGKGFGGCAALSVTDWLGYPSPLRAGEVMSGWTGAVVRVLSMSYMHMGALHLRSVCGSAQADVRGTPKLGPGGQDVAGTTSVRGPDRRTARGSAV
jgi:hypothetical protein